MVQGRQSERRPRRVHGRQRVVEHLDDALGDLRVQGAFGVSPRRGQARPDRRNTRHWEEADVGHEQAVGLAQGLAADDHAEHIFVGDHQVGGLAAQFGHQVLGVGLGGAGPDHVHHLHEALWTFVGPGADGIALRIAVGPAGRVGPGDELGARGLRFRPIAGIAHDPDAVTARPQLAGEGERRSDRAAAFPGGDEVGFASVASGHGSVPVSGVERGTR